MHAYTYERTYSHTYKCVGLALTQMICMEPYQVRLSLVRFLTLLHCLS